MRVLPKIAGTTLGLVMLAGVMSPAHADRKPRTITATTPIAAPNCMAETLDPAGEGRRTFMRLNCYSCHGGSGHGGTMGPSLIGEADETREAVTQGKDGGMPSYQGYLCDNDVANLTAYLQSLGTRTEPTFTHWWEPNPSR